MEVRYKRLHPDAIVPAHAHSGDAGSDLYAIEAATIKPGDRIRVGTGIAVAIPVGCAGFVLPRSGLANKHGVTLTNSPGLIDAGYRGELQVLLLNTDQESSFEIAVGDRIAQLVVVPFVSPQWQEVEEFDQTTRGSDGFGSSGV